ncbi:ANTAR domain-containing protein [Arthrobacter sp. Ld5]|uniref:ANTAR domain-containing protein n=1 Tax=Arthrobacter sp. Ld5 TaxID=649152 RepID=UPI003EB99849
MTKKPTDTPDESPGGPESNRPGSPERRRHTQAGIEQAQGIVLAQHHCTSTEAVSRLKNMSNETHVKLKDVLAAIIYQMTAPRRGG